MENLHYQDGSIFCGYFSGRDNSLMAGRQVFLAVSQDTLAHEIAHPLIMGMSFNIADTSLEDEYAIHEGFADMIAFLQHFWPSQVLRDQIRPTARELVAQLEADGLRVVILTGDRTGAAAELAAQAGVKDVRSQLRPEEKVAAIQQLKAGSDFATLAKRLSGDQQSAQKGGELGWFGPRDVDPKIIQAISLLKKGEVTPAPVQTQYGWHVIQLEDTRDRPAPAFDDVKERLTQIVVAKKFKTHSDEMLKTAKIDPPLTTAPLVPAPVAAPAPAPAN
jgi:hypothetical protein